ncbi:MAG TPA: metal ABC transporter permease [Streptosporangiaceae bacterium]|jgi:manganese/iron transport system permease protein
MSALPANGFTGFTGRAGVELVLAGAACGALGVQVVLRRLAFYTETVGHAAFPGILLAAVTGQSPVLGAAVTSAAVVTLPSGRSRTTVTGVMAGCALAIGVVLASASHGFSKDLAAALVGSPLTVTTRDLAVSAATLTLVVVLLALFGKELLYGAFDPATMRAAGYPVRALETTLRAAIAVIVATAVPAVGAVLPLALLIGPAGAALLWTRRIAVAAPLGACLGAAAGLAGLEISLHYRLATGATVTVLCGAVFLLAAATSRPIRPGITTTRDTTALTALLSHETPGPLPSIRETG